MATMADACDEEEIHHAKHSGLMRSGSSCASLTRCCCSTRVSRAKPCLRSAAVDTLLRRSTKALVYACMHCIACLCFTLATAIVAACAVAALT
eukprot:17111-Heterococcus_DN1.PRE.1